MEPRISMITLGVKNIKKSLAFYQDGLGWEAQSPQDDIAFFQLNNIIFSIYEHEKLAEDAAKSLQDPKFRGFTLAYNVASETEVETALQAAEKAGAKIVKPAQKAFWGGYSGYFEDPDGFSWEVAHNPYWKFDKNGNVLLK